MAVSPRARARLKRWGVRFAIGLGASWLAWTLTLRAARATVYEKLLGMGYQMASFLDDPDGTGAPRKLTLNDQPVHVATGSTDRTVREVIEFYKYKYASRDGGFAKRNMELLEHHHAKGKMAETLAKVTAPNAVTQVYGEGGGDKGFGAFIDLGESGTAQGLGDRLAKFERTGQVSDFGRFYYVHARKHGGRTSYLLMWTDKSFNVYEVMGGKGNHPGRGGGDTAGKDLEGVPRYPGSTRRFHAAEPARDYSVVAYRTVDDPAAVEAYYRNRMPALGWTTDEAFDKGLSAVRQQQPDLERALRFSKGNATIVMSMSELEGGETSLMMVGRTNVH